MGEKMTLLPCPVCRSEKVNVYYDKIRYEASVRCFGDWPKKDHCRWVAIGVGKDESMAIFNAIATWNNRAHLAAPTQTVDIEAVREVIAWHRAQVATILNSENYVEGIADRLAEKHTKQADKLSQAIKAYD